jgi:hypothetical protein
VLENCATVAALGGALWAVRFLIPRAVRQKDPLALICALTFAALSLGLWLLIGVAVRGV